MTNTGLYLEQDGKLTALPEAAVLLEDELQVLIADYPAVLSGDDAALANRRWLLIRREHGIAAGEGEGDRFAVDHLFVDDTGIPTLVEVKRAADTRIRREVVAQMLDYAANARAFTDADVLRRTFEAEHDEPDAVIRDFLGAVSEPDQFWQTADANMRGGKLRLIFVADRIPRELQTLVEFLDTELETIEVQAVEVTSFQNGDKRVIRARTVGQTQLARSRKGTGPSRAWDKPRWLETLTAKRPSSEVLAAQRVFRWAETHQPPLSISFGSGTYDTAAKFGRDDENAYLYPFYVYSSGSVEIRFQAMANDAEGPFGPAEARRELFDRLNAIPGVQMDLDRIAKWPGFPLEVITDDARFDQFVAVMGWAFERADAHGR